MAIAEILAIDPAQFECPQIERRWAEVLARQIEAGRADMFAMLEAEVPAAISCPFFDAMELARTVSGKNACRPGPWRMLGLPESVSQAIADGINRAADRVR